MGDSPQVAAAEFHRLFREHWDAGTGLPDGRRRPLGSWTVKHFADALARLNCPVDEATIRGWVVGRNLTDRRAMLAILATFFPAPADGAASHPDRQRMLDAWTDAQRRAGRPVADAAAMQQAGAALLALPREPDAIGFVVAGTRLAIAPPAESDRAAAALPVVGQLLPLIVEKLAELIEVMGERLDSQRAWRGLPKAARALHAALGNAVPETLPDQVIPAYHRTLTLGSFIEFDNDLGAAPNALDEPLEPEIRRALTDALGSLAPWLLQFPSIRDADAAKRDFLSRPELFETVRPKLAEARAVLEAAAAHGALSAEDAAEAAEPLDIAERPGVQGEKAGYRAVATAKHLVVTALAWKLTVGGSFLAGAVSSDYATKSALVQTLGTFLARTEQAAIRLVEGAPYELVAAVRHGLALAKDDAPGEAPPMPPTVPPMRRSNEEEFGPPEDFDFRRLQEIILAGQTPPAAWVPWIRYFHFSKDPRWDRGIGAWIPMSHARSFWDTSLLSGLSTLERLDLRLTRVENVTPLINLDKLEELLLAATLVSNLEPLACLTKIQRLDLSSTKVSDLNPLASLRDLRKLWLSRTSVSDLGPLAKLPSLVWLDLAAAPIVNLAPLANLGALQQLDLADTEVADVSPLAGLDSLARLDLASTNVTEVEPLASLPKLRILDLSRTRVSSVASLAGLTRLRLLHLRQTSVVDLAPLARLSSLTIHLEEAMVKPADLAREGRSLRVADILAPPRSPR
jgi:hypothetical protein